jgi:signal transduction histidine kinase
MTDRTMAQLEATRRLAALDELKNSMLTAVSHELRTPLAAILGASPPWSAPVVECRRRRPLTCSMGSAPAPASSTGY